MTNETFDETDPRTISVAEYEAIVRQLSEQNQAIEAHRDAIVAAFEVINKMTKVLVTHGLIETEPSDSIVLPGSQEFEHSLASHSRPGQIR